MKKAICLLCVTPHDDHVEFYSGFTKWGYDVFILCDSTKASCRDTEAVRFIQVEDSVCISSGYHHFNTFIKSKPVCSAWDKALFFFAEILTQYDFAWLVEEDVFIPRHQAIADIDKSNMGIDFLVGKGRFHASKKEMRASSWRHWSKLPKLLDHPPYLTALCCATRLSRHALLEIRTFSRAYHRSLPDGLDLHNVEGITQAIGVPFLEIAFPTIAMHSGLKLVRPDQMLHSIVFRWGERGLTPSDVDPSCLYHPLKDIAMHKSYRQRLTS